MVFHVSLLRLCKGDLTIDTQPLPPTSVDNNPISQLAAIIDYRAVTMGTELKLQILV